MSDYSAMSDADLMAAYKSSKDPFGGALEKEGVTGKLADVARSIYQQESGGGKNTKTSNAGAVGGMQIIPSTFAGVADKGWDIANPEHNMRAGIRYLKQLDTQSGGVPELTAAGYYGGPGGMEKARKGIAVSDPRNPNAPTTLQYGQQVAARMPKSPIVNALNSLTDAVIPSANAAQPEPKNAYAEMSDADLMAAYSKAKGTPAKELGYIESAAAGLGSGVGRVALGAQHYVGKALGAVGADTAGKYLVDDAAQGRAKLKGEIAPYKAANPMTTGGGELGGEILATLPVGGFLGAGAKAAGATRLGTALASSGMTTGAKVGSGFMPQAADLAIRSAAGAGVGGATAGLIEQGSEGMGAFIGGAFPIASKIVSAGFNGLGATLRPFFAGGQDKIAGNTLREFASNPKNALAELLNARSVVPGSAPTTAMAAGDDGIAALSRAMQNADPRFASELAARQTAQNQARTSLVESVAGNTGKLEIAKAARNAVTSPMRESVLSAAGGVPSNSMLSSIDRLIAQPDNAGKLSQQALTDFRGRIAQFSNEGQIDARALYAIRKDINDVLGGKLQGEAGNMRYAAGQLTSVKGLIDDAIDQASRRVNMPPTGTAVMPYGSNVSANTIPTAASGPRASWADYLKTYTDQSIPINQMERLDKVLKSVQTGTVDSQGGLILSGAKLNNILKNEGDDLIKNLAPAQMDILRRVSADLNASQISATTGRAVGSNTLQNMSQNHILTSSLGKALGGSTVASSTMGRVLQLPYGTANKQIQERLGNALLDPKEAARLMQTPQGNKLLEMLSQSAATVGYKTAPAISAR